MPTEPETSDEFIREVLADVINEGYTSELAVSWIKSMLKDVWYEGESSVSLGSDYYGDPCLEYLKPNPYA